MILYNRAEGVERVVAGVRLLAALYCDLQAVNHHILAHC